MLYKRKSTGRRFDRPPSGSGNGSVFAFSRSLPESAQRKAIKMANQKNGLGLTWPLGSTPNRLENFQVFGSTEDDKLNRLYFKLADWIKFIKEFCYREKIDIKTYLHDSYGVAVQNGHVRDCEDNTLDRLLFGSASGPDMLLFFCIKCPHFINEFLKGKIPPYPWRTQVGTEELNGEKPNDLITLDIVVQKYIVSRTTIKRNIKKGEFMSYRPKNAANNSPHFVSEKDVAARYRPRI